MASSVCAGPPQRVALGDHDPPDVAPAALVADRDRAQPAAARAALGVQRRDADALLRALDELLEAVGRVDRVAVAGALGGAVGGLLHRLDADDADAQQAAEAVAGHVGVERVAVVDVADLALPDRALGAAAGTRAGRGRSVAAGGGRGRRRGRRPTTASSAEAEGSGHRGPQPLAAARVAACNQRARSPRRHRLAAHDAERLTDGRRPPGRPKAAEADPEPRVPRRAAPARCGI